MKKRTLTGFVAALAICASSMMAAIAPYSQDFEAIPTGSTFNPNWNGLGDGWQVYGNVFNASMVWQGGYGPFDAPNWDGPGFSSVATGSAGAEQGTNYLNVYSNYDDGNHASGNFVEANVYRDVTIDASNVGQTWRFSFDAYKTIWDTPEGSNTDAIAFIKVNYGIAQSFDSAALVDETWTSASMDVTITGAMVGQSFQIGFSNTATLYDDTGVYYDNVSLAVVPEPSTYALLLGFGALGFVLYRRRRQAIG